MSAEVQRIVVIQDASRDVSPSAIRWILQGFSLKPGDVLILFGVLHQVNNPSMLSFLGADKLCKNLCLFFCSYSQKKDENNEINELKL